MVMVKRKLGLGSDWLMVWKPLLENYSLVSEIFRSWLQKNMQVATINPYRGLSQLSVLCHFYTDFLQTFHEIRSQYFSEVTPNQLTIILLLLCNDIVLQNVCPAGWCWTCTSCKSKLTWFPPAAHQMTLNTLLWQPAPTVNTLFWQPIKSSQWLEIF